jgi:SAM-dependent methyltransferase
MDGSVTVAADEAAEFFDLEQLAKATRLGDWMFEQFSDAAHGRVAEVGSGIGTFSERLLRHGVDQLLLIEPARRGLEELERRFGADPRVELSADFVPGCQPLQAGGFDFVLSQNVIEHIEDDAAAVHEMGQALAPGGTLGLLVPAHPRLYGNLDAAYGHHRRYTRERLSSIVTAAGLRVESLYSFNLLGVLGWLVKRRQTQPSLDPGSIRAYEAIVRFWRPLEQRVRPPAGLSLIVRGVRPH